MKTFEWFGVCVCVFLVSGTLVLDARALISWYAAVSHHCRAMTHNYLCPFSLHLIVTPDFAIL